MHFTIILTPSADAVEELTTTSLIHCREPLGKVAILVAEDNPTNQTVIMAYLAKLGHTADLVSNGQDAIQAVTQKKYSIILMDCLMPVMDGYEATKEIVTKLPAHERPRIIALTASAREQDRERCLSAGMDEYLTKPIKLKCLRELLQNRFSVEPEAEPMTVKAA